MHIPVDLQVPRCAEPNMSHIGNACGPTNVLYRYVKCPEMELIKVTHTATASIWTGPGYLQLFHLLSGGSVGSVLWSNPAFSGDLDHFRMLVVVGMK
jgi:hypothetical protein